MTLSRHPGPRPVRARFLSGAPDLSSSFRPMRSPAVSPADARPALGPRSLDPGRPFRERVCRAYLGPDAACRLLQLHDRHAGNQTANLVPREGRRPRPPSFSFLPRLSLAEAVAGGEPRYARIAQPRCRFLPLSRVCPTAMPTDRITSQSASLASPPTRRGGFRHLELSDDLRARVSGPSEGRVPRTRETVSCPPVGCSCFVGAS